MVSSMCFFFNVPATTAIYTLSLHDALPIYGQRGDEPPARLPANESDHISEFLHPAPPRSEEHTSELQSPDHLVCRLLLEKKKLQRSEPIASLAPDSRTMRYSLGPSVSG